MGAIVAMDALDAVHAMHAMDAMDATDTVLYYTLYYTYIYICSYTVSPVGEADRDVRAFLEIETRGFAEQAEDAANTL